MDIMTFLFYLSVQKKRKKSKKKKVLGGVLDASFGLQPICRLCVDSLLCLYVESDHL